MLYLLEHNTAGFPALQSCKQPYMLDSLDRLPPYNQESESFAFSIKVNDKMLPTGPPWTYFARTALWSSAAVSALHSLPVNIKNKWVNFRTVTWKINSLIHWKNFKIPYATFRVYTLTLGGTLPWRVIRCHHWWRLSSRGKDLKMAAARVLVYGGKGALGATCVSYFKSRDWVSSTL